ncbi:helix-loop-helix DNA-binding domain-domain-containing protein, partial [Coniella lustricola]
PVYNSIEDWNADLTNDSAPSPVSGSPISPDFNGFSFSNPGSGGDWAAWDKIEQSPESDLFLKSELLDSPDLNSNNTQQFTLNETMMSSRGAPQPTMTMPTNQSLNLGLPTPPEPTPPKERRYPVRTTTATTTNSLKRKSSDACGGDDDDDDEYASHASSSPDSTATATGAAKPAPSLGPKKTAHNMIEKRYRTNLNDKIAALRDSVPALRVMVHRLENHAGADQQGSTEDIMDEIQAEAGLEPGANMDVLNGVTPAHKLNKATILSKATEYIAHLERKNRSLAKENCALRNRVEGFEMLVLSRGGQQTVWN